MSRNRKYLLLGSLYVSQFLGVGFLLVAMAGILREEGASLEQIGLVQGLGLFWALKFLWAPLLDRYGSARRGHYRGWLLVLQPLMIVAILAMLPFDVVDDFGVIVAIASALVALSATQDIAADALAVRILEPSDRGFANGVQVAGGYLGNVLGGGLVLVVYDLLGWPAALLALAAMTALPLSLIVSFREPPRIGGLPSTRQAWASLGTVFRVPGAVRWALVVVPLLQVSAAGSYALLTPALVDIGWSLALIGIVLNIVASLAAVAGAIVAGSAISRVGARRVLLAGVALTVVSALAVIPVTAGSLAVASSTALIALVQVAYVVVSAVVYTTNMNLSRQRTAGTDFTTLTSFSMIASLVGGGLIVALAGTFGYATMLVVSAVLAVLGLVTGWGSRALNQGDPDSTPPEAARGEVDPANAEVAGTEAGGAKVASESVATGPATAGVKTERVRG